MADLAKNLKGRVITAKKGPLFIRSFLEYDEIVDLEKVIDAINEYLGQGNSFENLERLFAAYARDYDIYKEEKRIKWTKAPQWVTEIGKKVKKEWESYYGRTAKEAGWNYILTHCHFDHAFFTDQMYINEPYEVSMEGLKRLLNFCEEHGLYCYIQGKSWHFLGRTVRIVVKKAKRME